MIEERKPFWVMCGPCNHCWSPAYLPIDVSKFTKIVMKAACPMCGASGRDIVVAKQDDGRLLEPAQKGANG